MDSRGKLYKTLQDINTKIHMMNQRYTRIKTPEERVFNLKDLMQTLERLDTLLNLNFRDLSKPMRQEANALGIPYEIVPEDAIIDAFIAYNSFNPGTTIIPPPNTTLYPLNFPYSGAKGPRSEIEQIFTDYLGKTASGNIPAVLGNEPLDIRSVDFKPTSILKFPAGLNGMNTLIGIIDTGIDYTNPTFTNQNGETRIISIWDQTIGTNSPYGYGTVYDQEMINTALKSPDPFTVVPHKDEWGHGTILAGIAAGLGKYKEGTYEGVAPGAELIIVKLKPASDAMQILHHGAYNPLGFSALDIVLAFQFITILANQIEKPVSICLPSGSNSGDHDGTNVLDAIINGYSLNEGVCTVLAVGEEANKAHHASGDLKEEREQIIRLRIPKGQVGFVVEIWASFGDRIEVLLTPPKLGDNVLPSILLNESQIYRLPGDSSVWSQGIGFDAITGSQVIRFRFDNPIEGEWTIRVKGVVVAEGIYHIWIPKTGMILAETVLSPASPFTTIYNASAATGVVAIGCYDKESLSASGSSGRGFTRDHKVSPDYIVDGIDIPGPLPKGEWGLITGTAPASAITVGISSLIYEEQLMRGEQLANSIVMKAILSDKVKRHPTVSYPNPSSGYGIIDINAKLF